uniref:Nucleolus and neural progenitor protein-like N-terminal domain-containing protein n=1 Tax=Romanomermis culicivorax TaxID=13658 RepID=A0A915JW71_ROMCU
MTLYEQQKNVLIVQKYSPSEQRSLNLLQLKDKLSRMCTDLSQKSDSSLQNLAAKETYILSRLIRQLDNAFRRHKHFQLAKKILKIISLVNQTDLPSLLVDLHSSIQLSSNDGSCYCMNAEYFDYFLKRWSVLQNLIQKIETYCEYCYRSLSYFMETGHFAVQCCIFVGCIAAIRKKSRDLRSKLISFYGNLRSDVAVSVMLKANDPNYIRSDWYIFEEVDEQDTKPNFVDVKECMSIFGNLLSDFNSPVGFKVGLNRVLIDKQEIFAKNSADDVQNVELASKIDFGIRIERKPHNLSRSSQRTAKIHRESDLLALVKKMKTLQDAKKVYSELKSGSWVKISYFKVFKSKYAAALKERKCGKSREEIGELFSLRLPLNGLYLFCYYMELFYQFYNQQK